MDVFIGHFALTFDIIIVIKMEKDMEVDIFHV